MAPTTTTKKATTASKAGKTAAAHPSFQAMIQECIATSPDARQGVSRPAIKKFLADKYKLDMSSAANLNHVNKAIARGVEVNVFDQPKGAGGKVKLIKKTAANKENVAPTAAKKAAPAKKSAATTAAAKKAPAKKATATKTTAAKKAPVKKTTTAAAKKTSAPKKVAAKSTKAPAKKATATKKK